MACRIYDPDDPVTINEIRSIKFEQHEETSPQVIGVGKIINEQIKERAFYWGHQVKPALDRGDLQPENIVRLWKLLLYKPFQNAPLVKRLKAQLKRLKVDLVELISLHLQNVISDAKDFIKASPVIGGKFVEAVDTLPVKVFLSVPLMWKAPANRTMLEAAKRADLGFVELVHEPECAAAYYTHRIADNPQPEHVPGYELIICDIGGGTGDFVTMQYQSLLCDGAKVKLAALDRTTGKPSIQAIPTTCN